MLEIQNILFIGLLFVGVCHLLAYFYIALWLIPNRKEDRAKLSLYAMICASAAIFSLLLAWRIREPLAKDFVLIFILLSLIIGYLLKESAISPYKLADFWSKFGMSRKRNEENEHTNRTNHHS